MSTFAMQAKSAASREGKAPHLDIGPYSGSSGLKSWGNEWGLE
jgi:hypothetical protein